MSKTFLASAWSVLKLLVCGKCSKVWSRVGRSWEGSPATLSLPLPLPPCHPLLYRVLCSTWYLRRYITICFPQTYVATYSCLITFGSLASGRRKFGAWLEPAMRDSRCSTVGKGTPSCNLHRSTMDSNMVLYGLQHGGKAWEPLLIDIWKVANNGAGGGSSGGKKGG